jgi:isopentenyl diphosphate isomerase/L-lactate dehydrogenase-like FMN-dependent dehydrogenase
LYDFLSHDPYQYACINQDVPAESLVSFINRQLTPDFSWNDAEWLLGEWGATADRPAAIKGVIRPDDALHALTTGFSTIWISNHGGRQLDTAPATISVLPSIREAVGDEIEIIIDGGIQSGEDIAKALALGADGVGIGKSYLWGLCAGGYNGVDKVFCILRDQLEDTMNLLGTPTIQDLKHRGRQLVHQRRQQDV